MKNNPEFLTKTKQNKLKNTQELLSLDEWHLFCEKNLQRKNICSYKKLFREQANVLKKVY